MKIIERSDILAYLQKRNLVKQYVKAKKYLEQEYFHKVSFRKREPKSEEIWYFRINRQYRAYAYFKEDTLVVFEVNDHQ